MELPLIKLSLPFCLNQSFLTSAIIGSTNVFQLKEIIEEWGNLKIEAFQNRRSWVRATPEKE